MLTNGNRWLTVRDSGILTVRAPVEGEHAWRENLVIVPTYNEAINLKQLVPAILRQGPFDVLVVDDNSPDGTGAVAEKLAQRFPGRVEVLHRSGKLGLGTAYLTGFRYALAQGYQRVFTMDADFSHDPSYLPALRQALEDTDVALGSRYVHGGGTLRWPLWRRILSQSGSVYARLILGLHVRDLTGGFKGFRRKVLEELLPELDNMHSSGYAFQIETTYLCFRHGFRIVEVPIIFEDRLVGKSKMSRRIIVEALGVVLALRLSQTPLRKRLAMGLCLAVGMAAIGLAIVFGAINIAPGLSARLARAPAEQAVVLPHGQTSHSIDRRLAPALAAKKRPLRRERVAFLQLQGEDLTPNVPLHFTGSGFLPGEELAVTILGQQGQPEAQLTSVIADQAGRFSVATEAIPAGLSPGTHLLLVQGQSSQRLARASFQLHDIPPTVTLDTYTVKNRQDFGFAGNGFLPNEVVEVRLGSPTGQRLAAMSANAKGNVAGRVMVPRLAAGNYTLFFVGRQGRAPTSVGLNVQDFHPWVVLDNYAPSPHQRLGFTGEDFAPGEEVLVYLNRRGGEPIARLQADTFGRFQAPASWGVGALSGKQEWIFVGQGSGAMATATITIGP